VRNRAFLNGAAQLQEKKGKRRRMPWREIFARKLEKRPDRNERKSSRDTKQRPVRKTSLRKKEELQKSLRSRGHSQHPPTCEKPKK